VKVVKAKSAKSLWCGRVREHIRACETILFLRHRGTQGISEGADQEQPAISA